MNIISTCPVCGNQVTEVYLFGGYSIVCSVCCLGIAVIESSKLEAQQRWNWLCEMVEKGKSYIPFQGEPGTQEENNVLDHD